MLALACDRCNAYKGAQNVRGKSLEIAMDIDLHDSPGASIRVFQSANEQTIVGLSRNPAEVFVDRTRSGEVGFHKNFPGRHAAPIGDGNRVSLHMFLDASSVEVFVNNGEKVISDRVFPSPDATGVHVDAPGTAVIKTFQVWGLKSVWTQPKLAAESAGQSGAIHKPVRTPRRWIRNH